MDTPQTTEASKNIYKGEVNKPRLKNAELGDTISLKKRILKTKFNGQSVGTFSSIKAPGADQISSLGWNVSSQHNLLAYIFLSRG